MGVLSGDQPDPVGLHRHQTVRYLGSDLHGRRPGPLGAGATRPRSVVPLPLGPVRRAPLHAQESCVATAPSPQPVALAPAAARMNHTPDAKIVETMAAS